ncbi:MAG: YbaK/EbsC family protein [Bradymonadia bacterium]|jgi:Cys-tRNA(Pro)/Cys-tRNA(Cys) deacylase
MTETQSPAISLLNAAGAEYEIVPVTLASENPTAAEFARAMHDQHDSRLYKTIVLKGDKSGAFVCLVPYEARINYKQAATASGNHKCTMLALDELEGLTGYQRGACSPLGMKTDLTLLVDASAKNAKMILVNAGKRSTLLRLSPHTLNSLQPFLWVEGLAS